MALSPLVTSMSKAAFKAAGRLRRDFYEVGALQVKRKGLAAFVSSADLNAEEALRQALAKIRPQAQFSGEETGTSPAPEPLVERDLDPDSNDLALVGKPVDKRALWIVDPLAGTNNYLHGIPNWALSIAYAEEGTVRAAVVFDPLRDELFAAELNRGAFLNDQRIRVSGRDQLGESLVGTYFPIKGQQNVEEHFQICADLSRETAGIRGFGVSALALAYVAAGRLDAFWQNHMQPWHMAAGALLVKEAGGRITDWQGKPAHLTNPQVLASNAALNETMTGLLGSKS